jgi:division protein CdvB (Snf7/Vps24/ESCRT-III family)
MNDPKKSAEAAKKVVELQNKIKSHTSRIAQIDSQKKTQTSMFDQQIQNEQNQINRYLKEVADLKRLI